MVLLKSEEHVLTPGNSAPDFSLPNVDGKTVSLSDFKDMPISIIFMSNHCPYVKPKMQELGELTKEYRGKIAVIGINCNDVENYPEDSPEKMKEVAAEFGFDYYLFDESQEVPKKYGAVCTPDPFVFDKDHKLVYHGRINNAMNPNDAPTKHDMKEVFEKILQNERVEDWFVPSMGCSIKWKE